MVTLNSATTIYSYKNMEKNFRKKEKQYWWNNINPYWWNNINPRKYRTIKFGHSFTDFTNIMAFLLSKNIGQCVYITKTASLISFFFKDVLDDSRA